MAELVYSLPGARREVQGRGGSRAWESAQAEPPQPGPKGLELILHSAIGAGRFTFAPPL